MSKCVPNGVPDSEIPVVLSERSRQRRLARATKQQARFLRGPIPLTWIGEAACLPGKSLAVGMYWWFLSGVSGKSETLKLNCSRLDLFSLDRHSCARGLSELERAGLVTVKRSRGKCPRVTIVKGGGKP